MNRRLDEGPDRADFYGAAVYGSILAAALLTPFHEEHSSPEQTFLALLSTQAVFWLAHVWSTIIGERVDIGRAFDWRRAAAVAQAEWPLVEAAVVPSVPLLLGWVGAIGAQTATDLAIVLCVAQLLGWGVAVGWRVYGTRLRALVLGLVNGAFGVVIVLLEVVIVH
jgi:hypothetical protein